jgi:sulfur-carrier protein adenylyltransferase/sulfurtransferase
MPDRLPDLDRDDLERYRRHLLLPELGPDGQRRLKATRALLVGAGGLGSPAALYLAAAGVGHLTVVDFDVVDLSNLQRQVLHGTADVGRPKVESARDRLRALDPRLSVTALRTRLDATNALELVRDHDLVVDGSDSFSTRYLVSDACVLAGRPDVHASIFRFDGQATVLCTSDGPCYRCLFPSPPGPGEVPSCAEAGVLGVLPGLLGAVQATEAVKVAAGIGTPLVGRLLLVDALSMQFRTVKVRRDPACPACGTREIRELREESPACAVPVGAIPEIVPGELARRLRRGDDLLLVDVREPAEWSLDGLPGAVTAPLSRLESDAAALDRSREMVLFCSRGVRSLLAGQRLQAAGFPRLLSLAGGLARYRAEVEPAPHAI